MASDQRESVDLAEDDPEEEVSATPEGMRTFTGWVGRGLDIFMALVAVTHLYLALDPAVSVLERNAGHYGAFAFLAAIFYLPFRTARQRPWLLWIDVVLGVAVAIAALHLAAAETAIYAGGVSLRPVDWVAAIICILGAVELTRRLVGWIIPTLIVLALTYVGWWGSEISGIFRFPGLTWEAIAFRSIYGDDALFGGIASISATYVFLFIIFGAFLVRSGAGDFVIDLARAISGRLVGGPGFVAVISSALTGTISGSAIANTASTGVITIPMMQKAGFRGRFAGGVEAASSTGGQLMPPIMGAGAFVMASFTQIPYETIITVAILPAFLYFASVAMFVRIEAKRQGLKPMGGSDMSLGQAFKRHGASFVIPIVLLITLLAMGYTPSYAAVIAIVAVIAASWLTQTRMGPKAIFEALVMGTRGMILTAVLLCAVGLIVNVITTAGIGNTFSLMIDNWAGGRLIPAMILVALASLVLGMGLPVTAAYIVLATLSAPALAGMISDRYVIQLIASGELPQAAQPILMLAVPDMASALTQPMPYGEAASLVRSLPLEVASPLRDQVVPQEIAMSAVLSAHMIVFWLSQDSNVTPPLALAAFTAAAIARAPAMATAVQSWKLAKGLYIVPILFAFTPLLGGDWPTMLTIALFALPGIYGLAGALQGGLEKPVGPVLRVILGAAGTACLWPTGLTIQIVSAAIVLVVLVSQFFGPVSGAEKAGT